MEGRKPFHHGNLRAALLERAEGIVRVDGADALSIRELARLADVSHAAPRRHFPDRDSLLDAVAESGFRRVTAALEDSLRRTELEEPHVRFRAGAERYVMFAAEEANVHELMFTIKGDDASSALRDAADRFYDVANSLLTAADLRPDGELTGPRRMLVIAALQGIAALVAGGRLPVEATTSLLDEATRTFVPQSEEGRVIRS